ncbi:MAG: AAA domain-containing protein [Candidatus Latescibacteria bacterium]|nr:AAA domain-containing protein [Candidatus Latescibacterota bacterium]
MVDEALAEGDKPFEEETLQRLRSGYGRMVEQVRRVVVGQEEVVELLSIVLLSGGHALLTGAPGLAKTLLIRTLAQLIDLSFQRIQFTPDLMPADITGTELIDQDPVSGQRQLRFVPGPVFTHVLLADEINRTPPKTQAALLEAMEERQVTVAGAQRILEPPFYVLATQNPIELEGTYPLPEAQLDRFMFDIRIDYLGEDDELAVARRTTALEEVAVEAVFSGRDMLDFARLVRLVPVAEPVARYAVQLVRASRPETEGAPAFVRDWVSWGAGTRGAQNLLLGAKARALLQGRVHVSCGDIQAVAPAVLRHRILVNFRAEADGVDADAVIGRLLDSVAEPSSGLGS